MTLNFIEKVFEFGKCLDDEICSMIGVTLIMALVENLGENLVPYIDGIN
jgi:hypothetical protein